MNDTILDKILAHPYQYIIVLIVSCIALWFIGSGIIKILKEASQIIIIIIKEFSGKAKPKFAAFINLFLLVVLAILAIIAITPSLFSQLGFTESSPSSGTFVAVIITFSITAIFSGFFILQYNKENNAFRD